MLKGHRHIGHGTSSVPSWDWERGWQAWPEGNVAVAAGDPIGPQEETLRHETRPGHQVSHWPLPLACIGRQLRNDPWDQVLLYHDDHPKYAGQDETMDNRPAYDQALLAH